MEHTAHTAHALEVQKSKLGTFQGPAGAMCAGSSLLKEMLLHSTIFSRNRLTLHYYSPVVYSVGFLFSVFLFKDCGLSWCYSPVVYSVGRTVACLGAFLCCFPVPGLLSTLMHSSVDSLFQDCSLSWCILVLFRHFRTKLVHSCVVSMFQDCSLS